VGAKILQQQHSSKSFQALQKEFWARAELAEKRRNIAPTSFSPLALCDKKKKSFEPTQRQHRKSVFKVAQRQHRKGETSRQPLFLL